MFSSSIKHNTPQMTNTKGLDHYKINYDVDRFSFFSTKKIENMDQFRKNYHLNWDEIVEEYLAVGIGDVPHFASQYVFAKALHARRTSERAEMQTMYLDIVARVNEMIEAGELPLAI